MSEKLEERVAALEQRAVRLADESILQGARLSASVHVALSAVLKLLVDKELTTPQELANRFQAISDDVYFHNNSEADSAFLDQLVIQLRRAAARE